MRWGGTGIARISDQAQGVAGLYLLTVINHLRIQMGILLGDAALVVAHPNRLSTEASVAYAAHLAW